MPFGRFCIFGRVAGWHDGQDVVVFHFREEVVEFFRIEVADADGAEAVVSSGEPVGCYSEAGVYVAVVFVVEATDPGFVGVRRMASRRVFISDSATGLVWNFRQE